MAEIIRMPRLSDTMEEGVIVAWMKSVGDKVEPGDILAEVETDKATMDLESFNEGYLLHIGVEEGAVPVDSVIAVIGEKDEDFAAQLAEASSGTGNGSAPAESPSATDTQPAEAASESSTPATPEAPAVTSTDSRVKASPLARAMAQDAGLDINSIQGTGDQGRVVKRDVEAAISNGGTSSAPAAPRRAATTLAGAQERSETVPVSQMRKTIAKRLAESKFTAPHFYLTIEINMSQAVADRKSLNADQEVRVSFNDMVIKACAMALREHPNVNASWHGDTIAKHEHVHIGVAVAIEDGLLVPVIRHADAKGLRQIHEEVIEYAGRAKQKRLDLEEMQGNTFTISNLGMFGIEEFTAIINPPESCIMAVGAIQQKPIVVDGEIKVGHMMKVTMSCDHRVVDGATGAQFLQSVKRYLEHPVTMLG